MSKESRTITVAAAQLAARRLGEAQAALEDIEEAVRQARQAGADLVVLPECCYPAYWLGSLARYRQADILRGGQIERWFGELARRHGISIVAGVVAEKSASAGGLHDSAVFLDSTGLLRGRHDKTFLWAAEHDWYEPGARVRPVETEFGPVGMVICAEGRSPEVFASHAAQGAGLLAMPTAWVNAAARPGEYYNPQPDFLIPARAREFGLPIVCANKFGQECDEARFCGMSVIVSGEGEVLAKAPADEAALLLARVRVEPKRLILPETTVQRLLNGPAPVVPPADAEAVRVALLPPRLAGLAAEEVRERLTDRNVDLVLSPTQGSGQTPIGSTRRVQPQLQVIGKARVGFLTAGQARSFVWGRILALEGAQVLCVIGPLVDLPTARTRAVENRVFVVAALEGQVTAIGPNGAVIAQATATDKEPLLVDLALAEAGNKVVAPQTDVWMERRAEAYRLRAEDRG
jgi:predicted amidohydrolase